MNMKAMYKFSYGLFVLTTAHEGKDNGCIINTAIQAASEPNESAEGSAARDAGVRIVLTGTPLFFLLPRGSGLCYRGQKEESSWEKSIEDRKSVV